MATKQKISKGTFSSFLSVLRRFTVSHYYLLTGWLVTGLVQAFCGIAIPWLLKDMIDSATDKASVAELNHIGVSIIIFIVFYYIAEVILVRIVTYLLQKSMYDLRQELYSSVLNQPLSFSKAEKTGDVMFHIQQDTNLLEHNLHFILSWLLFDVFSVIGIFTLMYLTNAYLLGFIVVFLVLSFMITLYVGKPILSLSKLLQHVTSGFTTRLHDVFNGIRTVKSFGHEQVEIEKLDTMNKDISKMNLKLGFVASLIDPIGYLIEIIGVMFVIWYGCVLMLHGSLTVGTLLAFLMYTEILSEPFGHIVKYAESVRTCGAVSQRLDNFRKRLTMRKAVAFTGTAAYPKIKTISFHDVCFQYEHATRLILNNISLNAHVGKVTAIVGKNGSGKSTLMDLLMGLQAPQQGSILLNNTNIHKLKESEWRQKIGVLSQESYLFNDTIENNIAYGKLGATLKDIQEVSKKAGLLPIIARLPNGIQTIVGEKGGRLSGGEAQKIAIARIFLQNPDILIFDEPTSHLDNESTQEFINILLELAKQRIVFLIEHRPDVITRSADQIVLLDSGNIVAIGTHETLQQEPLYRTLLTNKKLSSKAT